MTLVSRLRPCLLPLVVLLGGCAVDSQTTEAAWNVVTLQTGTMSDLRDKRGYGPFRTYALEEEAMLEVLEGAMERADGGAEGPFVEVYVSPRYGEVSAKEFDEEGGAYGDYFRTAVLAVVHADRAAPGRCRVEVHSTTRGPFHAGRVRWERDLPRWIQAELAAREEHGGRPPPALRSLRDRQAAPCR